MIDTVLQITVPLFYLLASCGITRYVVLSSDVCDDFEKNMTALIVGLFWPVALPYYLALHNT